MVSTKRIIIFGRYPLPGKAKTRLIPALGKYRAADLQRRFTGMTVDKARQAGGKGRGDRPDIRFCFEGGNAPALRRWLGKDIIFSGQEGAGLGTRMEAAFARSFRDGCRRVLLIGTDVPAFSADHLRRAFEALDRCDVVLGPSTDGGYWLMGLKRPAGLFRDMDWGTDRVLARTRERARAANLTVFELEPLTDIDTIEDLREWNEAEAGAGPYLSVIIPALNEEEYLKKTIENAWDDEAEILVVDGGSTDRTRELAAGCGVGVISSPRGRARQQNHGANLAEGKVLLFLHADTILPYEYMDHVYEAFMDPSLLMGAFRFKTDLSGPTMRLIEWIAGFRSSRLKLPYGDQAFFIRRGTFFSMGGFPEVPIAEDLYLARQVSRKGRVVTLPFPATTSARRWRSSGLVRVTLINLIIAAGCCAGVPPDRLAPLYRWG